MKKYIISRGSDPIGVWPHEEVLQFLSEGRLKPSDVYWNQDDQDWVSLETLLPKESQTSKQEEPVRQVEIPLPAPNKPERPEHEQKKLFAAKAIILSVAFFGGLFILPALYFILFHNRGGDREIAKAREAEIVREARQSSLELKRRIDSDIVTSKLEGRRISREAFITDYGVPRVEVIFESVQEGQYYGTLYYPFFAVHYTPDGINRTSQDLFKEPSKEDRLQAEAEEFIGMTPAQLVRRLGQPQKITRGYLSGEGPCTLYNFRLKDKGNAFFAVLSTTGKVAAGEYKGSVISQSNVREWPRIVRYEREASLLQK